MEEVMALYEKMTDRYADLFTSWVKSNKKMRSIEIALDEIHSRGDIDIAPAEKVLRDSYKDEKYRNDKLTNEQVTTAQIIRRFVHDAKDIGIELPDKITDIRGY